MHTHRLDPDRLPMVSAVDWLVGRAEDGVLDLSRILVVTPGARAGRILVTLLAQACQQRSLVLTPPTLATAGGLVDAIAPAPNPAGSVHRSLAWKAVLSRAEHDVLEPVLPKTVDASTWADELSAVADELARGQWRCSDVAQAELPPMEEPARWHALGELQRRYEALLAEAGLVDPALHAIDHQQIREDLEAIVLLACMDLDGAARRLLRLAACPVHVLASVDQGLADDGVVDEAYWRDASIEIDPATVFVTRAPEEQGMLAVRAAMDLGTSAIGTADEVLAPAVRRAAHAHGLNLHVARGRAAASTGPGGLLGDLVLLLGEQSFSAMERVLRCPAVIASLAAEDPSFADVPSALDHYLESALPSQAFKPLPKGSPRVEGSRRLVRGARRRVVDAIRPLSGRPRSLRAWSGEIERTLVSLLGPGQDHLREDSLAAVEAIGQELRTMASLPEPLDTQNLHAHEALAFVCSQLKEHATTPEPGAEELDLLGWLELPLDPSPSMVVIGTHDSTLPGARSASPFLAEGLRRVLGLPGEDRVLARDAAAMTALLGGGRTVRFVLGTTNAQGDPTLPSTLLLRGSDDGAARVLARVAESFQTPAAQPAPAKCAFRVGVVDAMPAVERMSVTSFRTFLQSPYLFYLRHVLRLGEVRPVPAVVRLEPNTFGTIMHEALRAFAGLEDARGIDDEAAIRRLMHASLWETVERFAGSSRSATLLTQVDAAERRLGQLAQCEARWRQAGWRTIATEWRPEALPLLSRSGIALSGSIDRIDWHEDEKRLALLDYKTSEKAADPARSHRRRDGEWVDLQLPLYELLARPIAAEQGAEHLPMLAYVTVSAHEARVLDAGWDEADLEDARQCAERIGEIVRTGSASTMAELGQPAYEDAFTRLAGVGLLLDEEHRGLRQGAEQ